MTTQDLNSPEQNRIALQLRYQQVSDVHAGQVQLFTPLQRTPVQLHARIQQPMLFRDAMAALFAVVSSDYRYVPKDRTVYTAFMQMRRSNQYLGLAKAQRAYFDWLFANDPLAFCLLDPIITVHPDKVLLEVFSKDEGCYALLSFDHAVFHHQQTPQYGTTHIDYSDTLAQSMEQIRSFRETTLHIGQEAVSLQVETAPALANTEVIEKNIQVPVSWLRGLLQVQSAAHLPMEKIELAAIDVYNVLRHLRLNADIKGKRRGLAIELLPQQAPRLVLEPHDTVITSQAAPYQGKQAKVIRLWGRRRLALLQRLLPYADTVEVALLGNGMPSYWTLRGQGMSFCLAITGFSSSNWSQALNFDLLLPRQQLDDHDVPCVVNYLQQQHVASLASIAEATALSTAHCFSVLQQACQQGLVMYDRTCACYRYRPLTSEPLDMAFFRYRQPAEQQAYDLIQQAHAISALDTVLIPNEGIEVSATIDVAVDKRSYLTKLKLNEEGHVSKADCSCHQFMQQGLSHGPCSHLIALRMAYARHLAQRDPNAIEQETRLFARRRQQGIEHLQITLHKNRVFVVKSQSEHGKRQQLAFNSVHDARQAYLKHIQQIEQSGFIDSTLG